MATGDVVNAIKMPLERLKYKGKPFFGKAFSLLTYPPETVFSEKLHIVLNKRGQNTRMKDYYDLMSLMNHPLDQKKLKKTLEAVFDNRNMKHATTINFEESELSRLQVYWEHFLKREKMAQAPKKMSEIINKINTYLKKLTKGQN